MAQGNDIKIIFWGTPEFALPALEALIKSGYNIAAVVTNPDEPAGRRNILTSPPVKVAARKQKIPVLQPENLKDPNFKKELPDADLFIVAAYGKIIPKEILEIPKLGALNVHPSLLPRWRGPAPIQYSILNGDAGSGVTIMKMDEFMDHGPIIAASSFQLSASSKPTYKELHDRLAKLGAELLIEILPEYLRGKVVPLPQDDFKATYSKILKKDDGRIDWKKSAVAIERMVSALNPWPGTWTLLPTDSQIYRIKIEEGDASPEDVPQGSPGFIWRGGQNDLYVKTGSGSLAIKRLTLGGKKSISAGAFMHGYPHLVGTTMV